MSDQLLFDQILKVPIYNNDGTIKSTEQLKQEYDQLKQNLILATDIEEKLKPDFTELEQQIPEPEPEPEDQDQDQDNDVEMTEEGEMYNEQAQKDQTDQIEDDVEDDEDEDTDMVQHNGITKSQNIDQSQLVRTSDNLYFNIEITGDPTLSASQPLYNIIRDGSFISNASDYYLSIIRFNIPGYYAPIGYFLTQPNDLEIGIYSITLEVIGTDSSLLSYTSYLKFENPNILNTFFNTNPLLTEEGNNIYYIFNYYTMITSVNNAFIEVWGNITGDILFPYPGYEEYNDPFITYDPVSKLFTLWANELCILNARPALNPIASNPVKMYFNEYLYEFFNSFPSIRINNSVVVSPDQKDYQINILNNWENQTEFSLLPPGLWYKTIQDYITIMNWNPFSKIVMVTNLLPVQTEMTNGNGDGFLPIITDFIPTIDVVDVRSTFQYNASGQYRLVDLTSNGPINKIDLFVYWQDLWGNLNSLYLQPNSIMTIKLAFLNKEMYNNNHLYGYS